MVLCFYRGKSKLEILQVGHHLHSAVLQQLPCGIFFHATPYTLIENLLRLKTTDA